VFGLGGSIRIGRVAGIAIEIHYTWLLVVYLVTWTLLEEIRQSPTSTYYAWTAALAGSVLFLGSVLAHELAHSLLANRYGRLVDRITLFAFGGVAYLRQEPPSPRAEFLIAIAGPAMSLALAVVLGAAAIVCRLLPSVALPTLVVLRWLAIVNGILAVFNLLPAFPLDGGRVLRAILWVATRRFDRATRIAAGIGQAVGCLFVCGGIAAIWLGSDRLFAWLSLAVIGWMLVTAATQSVRRVEIEGALEGIAVGEIMTAPCVSAVHDQPLNEAVYEILAPRRLAQVPALYEGKPVGLLTAERVQGIEQDYWATMTVAHAMVPLEEGSIVRSDEMATKALVRMALEGVGILYVVDPIGRLVGSLSHQDLSQAVSIGLMVGRGTRQGGSYRYPLHAAGQEPPGAPAEPAPEAPGGSDGE
jgi:Zn-dependent protease